ncbi:uncharacterized protein F4807DRAFT_21781 [Annulohypoxylon truncatum]|uniref:uncharacterized protein n=1 Tax=Annulohypoxylon truncatum TaxID=327061 RepID=UPI002007A37A|nr:uncharacterized protein F4807DRAFT_21781 [Annulohypoxylon truncatum]KAI1215126.1 hypothetical protein F4807DRAFT_21781 [Annulohypoxylon truncatum]
MRVDAYTKETLHGADEPEKTEPGPPAYENADVNVSNDCPSAPQPATEGRFYFEDENQPKPNITLAISDRRPSKRWLGELQFKCINVPQIMREGLCWTMDNVSWEDGFFSPTCSNGSEFVKEFWMNCDLLRDGYCRTRHYFLRDLQEDPPRWVAHFQIYAAKDRTLAEFRLGDLSLENVEYAVARGNPGGRHIYYYKKDNPQVTFNAIYDDMPMEGWWPWPRKE